MVNPHPSRLAKVPLFEGLSEEQLGRLASWFDIENYAAGSPPARVDSHGYAFFVLDEGRAHAELDGKILETLEPGAIFGEMVFFESITHRTATVIPETPITVLCMFGTRFREMQLEFPDVAQRLQTVFEERAARVAAAGQS